jgi:hypothetical protein
MKLLRAALLLILVLVNPLPARATTGGEMMYIMARMMAVMMGDMMGSAMRQSASGGYGLSPNLGLGSGLDTWPGTLGSWSGSSLWPSGWNWPSTTVPLGLGDYSSSGLPYGYRYGAGRPFSSIQLQGRWVGLSGDVLDLRRDRFILRNGRNAVTGWYSVLDRHLVLHTPYTGTTSIYRVSYRGNSLVLQDPYGQILLFRRLRRLPPGRF